MQGAVNFGKRFDSCRASFADRWIGNRCLIRLPNTLFRKNDGVIVVAGFKLHCSKVAPIPIVGLPVRYRLDRVSGKAR